MQKKSKNIVLALLIFFIVGTSLVSSAVGGLSEAKIVSNYFDFDKAWIVDFVSDDFTTDNINVYFTPEDFEDAGGTPTKQSLTISAETNPNSCEWSLKQDNSLKQDVFYYVPYEFSAGAWNSVEDMNNLAEENGCVNFNPTGSDWIIYKFYTPLTHKVFCVKNNGKLGTVGEFANKFIRAETDWEIKATGKSSQTATISNSDTGDGRSTKIGDRVYIQWQGLASTGEDCPITQNAIPLHSNSFNQGWRIAKLGNYDNYNNYILNGGLLNDLRSWAKGELNEKSLGDSLSLKAQTAISQNNDFGSFDVLDSSISNGKISVDLGRLIVFPQFRLIIDADYLEIDISTGEPQIISVSDIEFTEGSAGKVIAVVKNKGNAEGGFTIRVINCDEGFSSNTAPQGITLGAGDQEKLEFQIIGSTTQDESQLKGSCQIEMKESITQDFVREEFQITMNQIVECPPPEYACGVSGTNHVVKRCNSEGTGLEIIERCEENEICKLTKDRAECRKSDEWCKEHPDDPDCETGECGEWTIIPAIDLIGWEGFKIPDVICHINKFFIDLRWAFSIILGFLGGLLGVSYTSKFMDKKSLKKNWWILLITFLVLGAGIGYLAFTYFWIILISLIILVVVRIFIPI